MSAITALKQSRCPTVAQTAAKRAIRTGLPSARQPKKKYRIFSEPGMRNGNKPTDCLLWLSTEGSLISSQTILPRSYYFVIFNFAMQTLTIRHTVARVTKVVEKNKTKNASSFRSFPLTYDAVRLFKILLQQEQYYRNHFGKDYIDNDYVFTWEDGHPYSPDYVSHTFHKLLKKYDLPHIRFHDLRHTCASMLLSEGYGLKDVQEWLGHSDIKMTANIYGHLDIRCKRSIANGLEQALPRLKP